MSKYDEEITSESMRDGHKVRRFKPYPKRYKHAKRRK